MKIDGIQHCFWRIVDVVLQRRFDGGTAQRDLTAHTAVYNLFNPGRQLMSAKNYELFRLRALVS